MRKVRRFWWLPSRGGGSLGLQSQSDDTGGHGGGEGGAWLWAGAAAVGARGHLRRESRVSERSRHTSLADTLTAGLHRITRRYVLKPCLAEKQMANPPSSLWPRSQSV